MEKREKRGNFTGQIGFVLAAAGSAVGLGNIWRFPYLAAKDGGGVFILCYIVLALTFGFTLLTTEIAIGRKTAQSPLTAYGVIRPRWDFLGVLACLVPVIILPYYCSIGGWVLKYLAVFAAGGGAGAAADGYFGNYISGTWEPVVWMVVYLLLTAAVVYSGIDKGIEKFSKVLMPILLLLVVGISVFSLTLSHTDENGVTRTGLEGLKIYLVPDFSGMTAGRFLVILMDAMGQLFFSISVAMGIMVAYGSYAKKETNLIKSINQIEFFDTFVALLAGMMIIPAVFTFVGTEGMSAGPGLMFESLPKVFEAMGGAGNVIGALFFLMVTFAAVTSSVSVMEAIVSSIMENGVTRTGLEGLKIYLVPDFSGMTAGRFLVILMDAMGQLFFSISVAMGIMVAYGSYAKKETNLIKSINQIEFFDTFVALLAGMMIIPAVFTFVGTEGMSAGPGLMFESLPKVFEAMGGAGNVIGALFFLMVTFAAVTSSVSVMEAIVSSIMDKFHFSRKKSTLLVTAYALLVGAAVCFGYNFLYFAVTLPNGTVGQILDVMDYISNNCLMPLVALLTCILVGWIVKPKTVIDEVTLGGFRFRRKTLYIVMIKIVAPILLFVLLLQSFGIVRI